MDPDLPESHLVALREELGHLFPGQLSDEFVSNMAGTRERLEAFSWHGSSEILEDGVADAGNRLSAAIMRAAFDSLDDGSASVMHDGETYRREDASRKRVMTSFGAIEYERPRYRRKGRPSLFPVDRRAGLIESFWTPRAARIALHRLALLPPRECVRTFLQQGGMRPSVASLVRLYETAGRRWEEIAQDALARIRDQEKVPDAAAVVSVQIDGVMVPMLPETKANKGEGGVEWREAACATISLGTAEGELLRTIRHGRMPERNKRRLKELMVEEVDALLAKRPDLRLVTIANGAHDNWRFLERAFPGADRVLDFFHAAQSLKKATDQAYGKDSARGQQRWRDLRRILLTEPGGVDRVIASLRYMSRRHAPSVSGVVKYFTNNRERMDYAEYKAENLMIGSGIVEATNKLLVTQRLKGSGMTWSMSGGEAILSLRALVMSDRFEAAWKILGPYWQNHGDSKNPEIVPI